MFSRKANCSFTPTDAQFAVNGIDVSIDSALADYQLFGNLHISKALRQQTEHLHLTRSQVNWQGWRGCGLGG